MSHGSDYMPGRTNIIVKQYYDILYHTILFETTSQQFQMAHNIQFNIESYGKYRIELDSAYSGQSNKKENIQFDIVLDDVNHLVFNKMNDSINCVSLCVFNVGSHNVKLYIKSLEEGMLSKLVSTRLELYKTY